MSIYAVSDLHGNLQIYNKIKEFLKPEDLLIILGDCGDRGSDGWEIIKDAYKNAGPNGNMIYLKGNHEDMLVKALGEYLEYEFGDNTQLLFHNGGYETYNKMISTTCEEWLKEYYYRLKDLPTHYILPMDNENKGKYLYLSHAGGTTSELVGMSEKEMNSYFLWNRTGIEQTEPLENIIWVHGHTPVFHFPQETRDSRAMPRAKWYSENRKVCIDMGTFLTDVACVLNLDTFEERYFSPKGDITEYYGKE